MVGETSRDGLRDLLAKDVHDGAQALLGCYLVQGELRAQIVEVESYHGKDDPGSHSFRGLTPRNRIMFGEPGRAYVYFTYGMYWLLNVVAGKEGEGCGVLLRAARPLSGLEVMRERRPKARRDEDLLSGPGRLAQAFNVGMAHYGLDLLNPESEIHIEQGAKPSDVISTVRVGLAPGKGDLLPYRYIDRSMICWASKPHPLKEVGGER